MPDENDVTPSDVLARIENSPYAELLHDEGKLERTLIELMAASEHPILAEMGRELEQGHVSWQDLGTIPAYREVLDTGFAAMQQIDLAEVLAGLDAALGNQDPGPASDEPTAHGEDEEPEELFRGLEHEYQRWSGRSPES